MANRFSGPAPTQNNNNFLSERSSTRLHKPPGGGSTVGSLIFGGGNDEKDSYLDERKGRRAINPEQNPNNNPIIDTNSYYGRDTQKDRITMKPGEVSRGELTASRSQQVPAVLNNSGAGSFGTASDYFAGGFGANEPQQAAARKQLGSASASSNYFANGMSGGYDQGGDNQPHRTRRMYAPPGGASSFKLG